VDKALLFIVALMVTMCLSVPTVHGQTGRDLAGSQYAQPRVGSKTDSAVTQQTKFKFVFGPGPVQDGYTQVLPTKRYTPEAGYGFEPTESTQTTEGGDNDVVNRDFLKGDQPFFFSFKAPEGTYRITLVLGDEAETSTVTVKAELRRLMLEHLQIPAGEFTRHTIMVNTRTPSIAGGGQVALKDREKKNEIWAWDDKITLEFNGVRPRVRMIEATRVDDLATLYLLGDSTVCDQPLEPWNSWGQMLPCFFKPEVAVANYAESGESLRSSLGARRVAKVMSLLKPGDYVMVQFGHNDMKDTSPNASDTYKSNLRQLVADVHAKGATPILITSMERKSGISSDTLRDYPDKAREVALEEKTALIDLHAMSKVLYKALGNKLDEAFQDGTHHNSYGSYQLAKCIVRGIKENGLDLTDHLVESFTAYDPREPDPVDSFHIPASPMSTPLKPLGN
jgi:lysophospholipase L1-like esterase